MELYLKMLVVVTCLVIREAKADYVIVDYRPVSSILCKYLQQDPDFKRLNLHQVPFKRSV